MRCGSVFAALLCVALAPNAPGVVDGAAIRLPLQRHASSASTPSASLWPAPPLDVNQKHSTVWEPAFPLDAHASIATSRVALPPVPVHLSADGLFATLSFGTPPQPVSVIVDLWSTYSFVVNHAIDDRPYYNHTESSSYTCNGTHVQIHVGDNDILDGVVSRDYVSVGSTNATDGIVVWDDGIVELEGPDNTIRKFGPAFRGWIGLGAGQSATTGAQSLPRLMINQELLDRPEIGVSFSTDDPHVVFGGVDAAYNHSDFHYFDSPGGNWVPQLRGISVNGTHVVGDAGPVMISYWPFVVGPKAAIEALERAVGVKDMELPCNGPGPDIVMHIGAGLNVTVSKKDYAVRVSPTACKFMFVYVGYEVWMLGFPFLRNVYTVLEHGPVAGHERVGFANLKRD